MPEPTRTVVLSKPSASSAVQTIRLGENLTDYLQQSTTEPMYTACYPLGASVPGMAVHPAFRVVAPYGANAGNEYIVMYVEGGGSGVTRVVHFHRGDRLFFGSYNGNGQWSVEVAEEVELTSDTTTYHTVYLETPLLTSIPANSAHDYAYKENLTQARPVDLGMLSDRTKTVDGVTYKKKDGFVYDEAAVERYGLKMMGISDSDRVMPIDLLSQAIYELRQQSAPAFTIEIQAVDMAYYTDSHAHLRPGEAVRVISEPHGLDEVMVVRKADIDLDDPGNTKYEIGKAMATATGMIRGAYGAAASVRERLMRGTR